MNKIISIPGIEITQKNFHQIIIRGDGLEKFNNIKFLNLAFYFETLK